MVLLMATTAAFTTYEDILSKLGLDKPFTNEMMFKQMTGIDEFRIPYMTGLSKVVAGDKVGAAKESFTYIRAYFESPEFAKAYAERREREKPTDEPPPMFDEETLKEMRGSIKEYEKVANDPKQPAATRASAKAQAEDFQKMVDMGSDPTPNKTKWEKKFPADPSKLITTKLKEYIDLVGKVDFNAQLAAPDKYGKKKFVNPEYEKKSAQWKAVYRAGKDVNSAVAAMAQDWMKQGIKIANPGTASLTGSTEEVSSVKKEEDGTKKADDNKRPTLKSLKDKYIPKKN